ncbi:MAG: VOC family protein [Deltaproteobacteria bacterium]|nr:VOC family protein [Deltaproteobacteria bacterium]
MLPIFLARVEDVNAWAAHVKAHNVVITAEPRTHRDGARSFYCADPDGNDVQIIFHPPIAAAERR